MHGVTHDPTLFHSVCWLAECIAANHQIDFALILSVSEGYFMLNLVKGTKVKKAFITINRYSNMGRRYYSIPFSPKLTVYEWIATFAVFSIFPYFLEGASWQNAIISGLVVSTVYISLHLVLVYVINRRERKNERESGERDNIFRNNSN